MFKQSCPINQIYLFLKLITVIKYRIRLIEYIGLMHEIWTSE